MIYGKFTGVVQGWIKGAVATAPFKDQIVVSYLDFGFANGLSTTGQITGKSVAQPVRCLLEGDKSAVGLMQAQFQNEIMKTVLFSYHKDGATGSQSVIAKVELANAQIISFAHASRLRRPHPSGFLEPPALKEAGLFMPTISTTTKEDLVASSEYIISVTLSYQKIEFTWVDGGYTAINDWSTH